MKTFEQYYIKNGTTKISKLSMEQYKPKYEKDKKWTSHNFNSCWSYT